MRSKLRFHSVSMIGWLLSTSFVCRKILVPAQARPDANEHRTLLSMNENIANDKKTTIHHDRKIANRTILPYCDLNCRNGGECVYISTNVTILQNVFQKGAMIQKCICPDGYTGIGCEIQLFKTDTTTTTSTTTTTFNTECRMSDKQCPNGMPCLQRKHTTNTEYTCECSVAQTVSRFAASMCLNPYTEYCSSRLDRMAPYIPFCTNGGKCKSSIEGAQIAPRDVTYNDKYQYDGCICPSDFYGPHCQYLKYPGTTSNNYNNQQDGSSSQAESTYFNWTKPDDSQISTGNDLLDEMLHVGKYYLSDTVQDKYQQSSDATQSDTTSISTSQQPNSTNATNPESSHGNKVATTDITIISAGVVLLCLAIYAIFRRKKDKNGTTYTILHYNNTEFNAAPIVKHHQQPRAKLLQDFKSRYNFRSLLLNFGNTRRDPDLKDKITNDLQGPKTQRTFHNRKSNIAVQDTSIIDNNATGYANHSLSRDEESNHVPSSFGISSLTYQTRTSLSESSSLSDDGGCHNDIIQNCTATYRPQTVLEDLSSTQLYSKESLYYGDQVCHTFCDENSQHNKVWITDDDEALEHDLLYGTLEVKTEQIR